MHGLTGEQLANGGGSSAQRSDRALELHGLFSELLDPREGCGLRFCVVLRPTALEAPGCRPAADEDLLRLPRRDIDRLAARSARGLGALRLRHLAQAAVYLGAQPLPDALALLFERA